MLLRYNSKLIVPEAGTGRASCLTTGTPAAGGTSTETTREMISNGDL